MASLDLLEKEETQQQIKLINQQHLLFQNKIKTHSKLNGVRVLGTIIAFELKTEEHTHYLNTASQGIAQWFLQKGILLRPLGNIFYVIPPYVITKNELNFIYNCIEEFLG